VCPVAQKEDDKEVCNITVCECKRSGKF